MRYWAEGEGAAKIRWGEPGDFDRAVRHLTEVGVPLGEVKGLAANLHHRALGVWPGKEHTKTTEGSTVDDTGVVEKAGPHGYIHGWVFVGVPGAGGDGGKGKELVGALEHAGAAAEEHHPTGQVLHNGKGRAVALSDEEARHFESLSPEDRVKYADARFGGKSHAAATGGHEPAAPKITPHPTAAPKTPGHAAPAALSRAPVGGSVALGGKPGGPMTISPSGGGPAVTVTAKDKADVKAKLNNNGAMAYTSARLKGNSHEQAMAIGQRIGAKTTTRRKADGEGEVGTVGDTVVVEGMDTADVAAVFDLEKTVGEVDAHGWVPISKSTALDDGTVVVEGIVSDSGIDSDQQIADPTWLDGAVGEWFRSGGNIREQHDPRKAAGVAVDYRVDSGAHRVVAHVIDPTTAAKVKSGVLRGFSFGASGARVVADKAARGGRIVDGRIYEVSLVDRPANSRCVATLVKTDDGGGLALVDEITVVERPPTPAEVFGGVVKRDVSQDTRESLADQGKALPGGGFPIANVADLRNAIRAVGRAKDPAAAKALIIRRAKALGRTDLLPDGWDDSASKADGDGADDGSWTHDPTAVAQVRDGLIDMIRAELAELENGEDELCDITQLLVALKMYMAWWSAESDHGETEDPYPSGDTDSDDSGPGQAMLTLADGSVRPGPVPGHNDTTIHVAKTETEEPRVEPDPELTALVKTLADRVESLSTELTVLKSTPITGGPARFRTADQSAAAARREALVVEKTRLRDAVEHSTGALRTGYTERLRGVEADLLKMNGGAR